MEVSGENFLKFVLLNCRQNLHGTHILVSFTILSHVPVLMDFWCVLIKLECFRNFKKNYVFFGTSVRACFWC